jgi:hypothetical protein
VILSPAVATARRPPSPSARPLAHPEGAQPGALRGLNLPLQVEARTLSEARNSDRPAVVRAKDLWADAIGGAPLQEEDRGSA